MVFGLKWWRVGRHFVKNVNWELMLMFWILAFDITKSWWETHFICQHGINREYTALGIYYPSARPPPPPPPPPGVHIITKSAKNMQVSGHARIVQLPLLPDKEICPVTALKRIVSANPEHRDMPVFTISEAGNSTILTAHKVRATLKQAVEGIGLPSKEYGFHVFHRSGATWAYENNIGLQHIKTHGDGLQTLYGPI